MDTSLLVMLCMTQTFEFAAGLWCIGQVASPSKGHVHSANWASIAPIQNAVGTIAKVVAWQNSQTAATVPRRRRARVTVLHT
jgi:hypothetical protein